MASTQKLNFFILIPTHVALIFPYLSQLDQKTSHVVSEICMWFPKQHDSLSKPRDLFSKFTVDIMWFRDNMLGSMWSRNYTGMWIRDLLVST